MAVKERAFVMDLTPRGLGSSVLLDGEDISTLLRGVIRWFELKYGYNADPSTTPDGEILRWALVRRAGEAR